MIEQKQYVCPWCGAKMLLRKGLIFNLYEHFTDD